MNTFFITTEERQRAQDRAAELDVGQSDPPGRYPYVWDNRQGSVKRWYDYASPEDKLGTIYFQPSLEPDGRLSHTVECTTELMHHPLQSERQVNRAIITDREQHQKLVEFFFRELLGSDRQEPAIP